jgi:hypothetical protein
MDRDGVTYTNTRKKKGSGTLPACILLRKNFWNGILAHSVKSIPGSNTEGRGRYKTR